MTMVGRILGLFGPRTRMEANGVVAPEIFPVLNSYRDELVALTGGKTLEWEVTNHDPSKVSTGDYTFALKGVANFRLLEMPGCCGVCISTGAKVYRGAQGKGIGTVLNRLRIDLAKELRYGLLMCTDIEQNTAQRKILKKNGWKDVVSFKNPRTNNTVFVTTIKL